MRHIGVTELDEHLTFVDWAEKSSNLVPVLRLLIHYPIGEMRPKRTVTIKGREITYSPAGKMLQRMGAKPGVPDFLLPVARGGAHGLWIEIKARNGRLSSDQRAWLQALDEQGYAVGTCYGADEAIDLITRYLRGIHDAEAEQGSVAAP